MPRQSSQRFPRHNPGSIAALLERLIAAVVFSTLFQRPVAQPARVRAQHSRRGSLSLPLLSLFTLTILFVFTSLFPAVSFHVPTVSVRAIPNQQDQEGSKSIPDSIEGLVLWLDAAVIESSKEPSEAVAQVVAWPDRSQHRQPLKPSVSESRPALVSIGDKQVVRFDGKDDFVRSTSDNPITTNALTAFIVGSPHSSKGDFRGFLAANAANGRDYETGFNIDLGPGPGFKFDFLNVEGRGFGGARDLFDGELGFGELAVIQLTIDPEARLVQIRVNGKAAGQREYDPSDISLQELTVGARYFTNGPGSQQPRSPFEGDLAEVLIFDRLLSTSDRTSIESYLQSKYESLQESLPNDFRSRTTGITLAKVSEPPNIQMLLPGFEVNELPVTLTNRNNVRYRSDGTLVTLGYNGDIHLLRDTDGDGLEDEAKLFWKNEGSLRGPIGMALTPENYPKGRGVFVPSKGKVSLIVDTNADDIADEEIVVATGWPEIFPNVDALGICLDKDNNLYFGLGVADFSNAYQVGDDGKARYNRHGENGTIQKVSADFSKRETICTGIRFPVAMQFNEHGDLFCTEQEGATWLPNGNPLDELLWIRPDRHYGFPPRHPQHNPGVIDEPSVTEFPPQHQSTCGMFFNRPVNGGPVFGDPSWLNDALICGESRGKIWRTTLQKTDEGYLAQKQLIACLQMLLIDACVAPNGDLVVCCHSGPPDWGTGPTGEGKLFRIRSLPADQRPPRPVLAWQQGPQEVRVSFDKPLGADFLGAQADFALDYGKYVQPGDEFENLIPPYVAVQRQLTTPRFQANVNSVSLTPDRHTLILNTDPVTAQGGISVRVPLRESAVPTDGLPQKPTSAIDVRNLGLLVNKLAQPNGEPIWLPHLNWETAKAFTHNSSAHRQWIESLDKGLEFTTRLNLLDMLRPAVQPGDSIDYSWPDEVVTVGLVSDVSFTIQWNQQTIEPQSSENGYVAEITSPANLKEWVDLKLRSNDFTQHSRLDIYYYTNEDQRHRVIPLERFHLPWIQPGDPTESLAERVLPKELEDGNWGRGRQVFHSGKANCYKCHQLDLTGGLIGPDLSNLRHRDYGSVRRDVEKPSFSINPDYTGQTILMDDGRLLTGILRNRNNQLQIGSPEGTWVTIQADEIDQARAAEVSIMPTGLLDQLSEQEKKDLFVYLLMPAPTMPLDSPLEAPPLRSRSEVASVLAGSEEVQPQPINIVLVAGPKDHGPGEHDYPAWQKQWGQLLLAAPETSIQLAWEFPDEQQLKSADVVIFFQKGDWNQERQQAMDQYFAGGGGAVYLHWAVNGNQKSQAMSERIGLASQAGSVGYRHGPLDLHLHHTDHPIMRNLGAQLKLYDESYWDLSGDESEIDLLASSVEDGQARPQIWTYQPGNGRVLVCIPGHYNWTFDDPIFRTLLLRGISWSAKRPVDRFNELVPLGARMTR